MASLIGVVYIEGTLLKRPRARKNRLHIMRFQERFCRLTLSSLKYYETKDTKVQKGHFEVKRIRIVEKVPDHVFKNKFCFQIGDDKEMMYLAAFTNESRNTWIETFKKVATDNGNKMLPWYHDGVFGKTLSHLTPSWSCCGMMHEYTIGCKKTTRTQTTTKSLPNYTTKIPMADNKSDVPFSLSLPIPICTVTSPAADTQNSEPVPHTTMSQLNDSLLRIRSPTKDSGKGDSVRSSRVTQYGSSESLLKETDEEKDPLRSELKYERSHWDLSFDERHSGHSEESQKTGDSLITIPSTPNTERPYSEHTSTASTLSPVDSDYEFEAIQVMDYTPLSSLPCFSSHSVKSLAFYDDSSLISTSMSRAKTWDIPDLTFNGTIETVSGLEISSLSVWNTFLAIGSNVIQIYDLSSGQGRRVINADEGQLLNPSMHLVAFGPQGHLVTVNSESKTVMVWPPPSEAQELVTKPLWTSGTTLDSVEGSICSFSVSANDFENGLWLAVGTSKGHVHVHLLKWKENSVSEKFQYTGVDNGDDAICIVSIPHSGRNVAAGCGTHLLVWDIILGAVIHDLTDSSGDQTISSLCYSPDDSHLAVGMSTGEVVVYEAESGNPIITLEGPEKIAITSMAYSGSGKYFAVGYNNGKIQLWLTSHSEIASKTETACAKQVYCSDLPLIGRVEDEILSREEEYIMEFLDYKIVVPANATHEGKKIPFQTGEMPFGPVGPFKFPSNTKPVSSIVWLHSNGMSDLQKPIKIILSHCLNCTSEDDLKQLVFMKADDNFKINEMGEREFHFHILGEDEREGEPLFTKDDGTLTTRYNCWYAICSKELLKVSREKIDCTQYCLTHAIPKHMTKNKYEIRFILSYFLKSCMKVIDKQYSETHDVTHKTVTFTTQESDHCIRVECERNLPNGWIVACPPGRSIKVKDVYFLEKNQEELELALKYKQYPPNIVLVAHGEEATGNTVLDVTLIGADEELKREIFLEKSVSLPVTEPVLPMDAVNSISTCSSYGITTATQTSIQCSENNVTIDSAVNGQIYPQQFISSLSPDLQQPPTQQVFTNQYEKHRTYSNDLSSSSPAQSTDIDPTVNPVQESELPCTRNGE